MARKHKKGTKKRKTTKKKAAKKGSDVLNELNALGRKVEAALKGAAKSKQARRIPADVVKGMRSVGNRLHDTLQEISKSEETQELGRQAKKVFMVGKKKGKESAGKLKTNLATGLRTLSQELTRLAGKIDK